MDDAKKHGHAVGFWCCCLVALIVAYPLSAGPVWRLLMWYSYPEIRYAPANPFSVFYFYRPLEWLSNECLPLGNTFDWYLGLWKP